MEQKFPKACRLRKTWEFQQVWKMGCKLHTPHFILLGMKNSGSVSRLGLTVSRKVGNAVKRNRLKRQIREYFRKYMGRSRQPADLSVIAKKGAADLASRQIFSELDQAIKNLEKRCS